MSELSTTSNGCTRLQVQLLDMVENSSSLCKSSLGWFFRQ
jgi:hypothetical protein